MTKEVAVAITESVVLDYKKVSYCAECRLKYPLDAVRCPRCGRVLRHSPRTYVVKK